MIRKRPENYCADLNLRVLWPMARCIEDTFGFATLNRIAQQADIDSNHLNFCMKWASLRQFETFVTEARALFQSDEAFKLAGGYRIHEAYGPLRFALWATSPSLVYQQSASAYHLVSSIEQAAVTTKTSNAITIHLTSSRFLHRSICLLRQGQAALLPTMWGLPPAQLVEDSCIGFGDKSCVYHLEWNETKRWRPTLIGTAIGSVFSSAIALSKVVSTEWPLALPVVGGMLGYAYGAYQANKKYQKLSNEIQHAVQELAEEFAETRQELIDFYRNQQGWTEHVQSVFNDHTLKIAQVMEQLQKRQEQATQEQSKYSNVIPFHKRGQ